MKKVHDWHKLQREFVELKIAVPSTTLLSFARDKRIDYMTLKNKAASMQWYRAFGRELSERDAFFASIAIENHATVISALRKTLEFTEQSVRTKNAEFAQAVKTGIMESLLGVDWRAVSLKDRKDMLALMIEVESDALGIHNTKQSIQHHVLHAGTAGTQAADGTKYLPVEAHIAEQDKVRQLGAQLHAYIEGKSQHVKDGQ